MDTDSRQEIFHMRRRARLAPLVLAVLLGFLAGFLVVQGPPTPRPRLIRGRHTVQAATRPQVAAGPSADVDVTTYYLVSSEQDRELAREALSTAEDGVIPGSTSSYVIAVVASPDEEAQLRQTIDDANRQVDAYGEPGFRIVDLR